MKGSSSDSLSNYTVKIRLPSELRFRKWRRYGNDAVSRMHQRLDMCVRGRAVRRVDFPGKKISKVVFRLVDEDF
jgi:hypothetical protein